MKRVVLPAAVALLLMMALAGDSFSRMHPYDYGLSNTRDDHTWGGDPDDGGGASLVRSGSSGGSGLVVTGYVGVDIFVNAGLAEWLLGHQFRDRARAKYYIIRKADKDDGTRGTNVNSKGNQK